MLDFNFHNCPARWRSHYADLVQKLTPSYYDGKVVCMIMTRGGANALIVYKNPRWSWYDGFVFYSRNLNGNWVSDGDTLEDVRVEMQKQINLKKAFNEGNYEYVEFESN